MNRDNPWYFPPDPLRKFRLYNLDGTHSDHEWKTSMKDRLYSNGRVFEATGVFEDGREVYRASGRVEPFSNGSQYIDWRARNCDRCKKDYDGTTDTTHCELEQALSLACVSDGSISEDQARRIGVPSEVVYGWHCPEKELKEDETLQQ